MSAKLFAPDQPIREVESVRLLVFTGNVFQLCCADDFLTN
jgi:hypothetical protein